MEPIDKFGRPIYGKTWSLLLAAGQALNDAGYTESPSKANLFSRRADFTGAECRFFADMRGTAFVPVWEDPDPLFYSFWRPRHPPAWLARRAEAAEEERLLAFRVRTRHSFYADEEPGGLWFDGEAEGDGYCRACGADFQDAGRYGPLCKGPQEAKAREARLVPCAACKAPFDPLRENHVRHHTSYFPERTVLLHEQCHARIHLHGLYPELAPPAGDARVFYRR